MTEEVDEGILTIPELLDLYCSPIASLHELTGHIIPLITDDEVNHEPMG